MPLPRAQVLQAYICAINYLCAFHATFINKQGTYHTNLGNNQEYNKRGVPNMKEKYSYGSWVK